MIDSSSMTAALAALRDGGLLVDSVKFDGALHRVPTSAKPKSKNGWYVAHADVPVSVAFGDWGSSGESGTWTAKGDSKLTASEKAELSRRMEEARKARKAEQARVHAEAANKAHSIYIAAAAADCLEHAYLTAKGVKLVPGLKLHKEAMVVPLYDDGGKVVSLQFIGGGGNKRFLSGGRKKGCFFPIGNDTEKALVICEGLATGLSLYESVGLPVLVAFDAGNLLPVAEVARRIYPDREIILAADNDTETEGNPGVAKATTAALAVGGSLAIPRHEGQAVDWNDLHQKMGAGEVVTQFSNHTKPEAPAPVTPPLAADADDDRPTIAWREFAVPEVLREAEAAILLANSTGRTGQYTQLFQRGREVVIVEIMSSGTVAIRALSAEGLSVYFATVAKWAKFSERKNEWVPCGVPATVGKSYLAWAEPWLLPNLKDIINAPTLRPDGSILDIPGYDAATCLFFEPCGESFPPIPQNPTKDDAVAALARLRGLICEFPTVDDSDRSVVLAAILTSLVRRNLPTAPLFGFTAPVMASGKTLLANMVTSISTGRPAAVMSFPQSEEELGKVIFAVLRSGASVAVLDNISEPVKSDTLNAVATSATYQGRVLGKSEQIELSATTLWLLTGNNLIIRGDLATRALICRLDPNCERPEQRRFAIDPLEYITAHRSELVRDALTVMRAYVVADLPDVGALPFGRFEAWSRLVRDSLVWCGEADPTATLERVRDDDPDRELLGSVLAAWFEVFKDAKVTTKELLATAYSTPELMEAIKPICLDRHTGEADQRSMGKWLARYSGRIVNGLKVIKAGTYNRAVQWAVIKTV